jgi:transcriptional regulator with XRE-family HTH domain
MGSLYNANGPTSKAMRKRAGAWLKGLREEAGLTQLDVAAHMGYDYTTMVSQIERGLGRVPPEDWPEWASLLRQDLKKFAARMLYWYDPHAHFALFGGVHPHDAEKLAREGTNAHRLSESGLAKGTASKRRTSTAR